MLWVRKWADNLHDVVLLEKNEMIFRVFEITIQAFKLPSALKTDVRVLPPFCTKKQNIFKRISNYAT